MARQIFPNDKEWDQGGAPGWRERRAIRTPWQRISAVQLLAIGFLAPFALLVLGAAVIIGITLIGDMLR